jgi:hypothetical protein
VRKERFYAKSHRKSAMIESHIHPFKEKTMKYKITLQKELEFVIFIEASSQEEAEREAVKIEDRTDLADYGVVGGSVAAEKTISDKV